ncbi:MAG: cupin domain-containing protein [Myxococcales bacterium]|nr:cupin domain-containing protein [Myxococcales bacterium]
MTQNALPTQPVIQRGAEVERINYSPSSRFRMVFDGAPGLPDFCEDHAGRGDSAPLHRHPWASWELIISGEVRMVIDGNEYTLGAGDSIYVPPNAAHTYVVLSERAHTVGVNLSDGRFPSLQRQAVPLLQAEGGPDMQKLVMLAKEHSVEVLGPPLKL